MAASLLLAWAFAAGADTAVAASTGASEGSPHPALLGRGEADLRAEFGAALLSEPIESRRRSAPVPVPQKPQSSSQTTSSGGAPPTLPATAVPATETKDPFAEQQRFVRNPDDPDVRRVEYELFRSRVYRVRWQLPERFERPIMASLVAHLTEDLGKPRYDQLIEGKFGTGRATLRRAAWQSGPRNLEIRQLNPNVGGPIFLTLSDQTMIKSIIASGGTAAPEPDSLGPWWQAPLKPSPPLTRQERAALLAGFHGVLEQADWAH